MERCHTPYQIQRVDYVCYWMEQVVCSYLSRPEMEWENIFYDKGYSFHKHESLIITTSHPLIADV